MKNAQVVVRNARQLLTMEPGLATTPPEDEEGVRLGVVEDGAVAIVDGKVLDIGTTDEIMDTYTAEDEIDAGGRVVAPGLVDPHTHCVFSGSRHLEFCMRMKGSSYLEILAAGGGIHSSVGSVRDSDVTTLVEETLPRLDRALSFGVTTIEVKSGYGLDTEEEAKMLEAVRVLDGRHPVRLVPTFLGAHVVPKEHRDTRNEYVVKLVEETIPRVAAAKLAVACDVFLDDGAFTRDEASTILSAAAAEGLALKIHAGQFTDQGGPELIARMGGLSADHLEVVSDAGIAAMAEAGVVANLLPGAAFSLRDHFPDGRRYADAGIRVALATDNNPGSSRTENLPLMATMGATRMGLTCAEAMEGITSNAARALGLEDSVGSLRPGFEADMVFLAIPDFRAFLYHFGINHAVTVLVGGKVAAEVKGR